MMRLLEPYLPLRYRVFVFQSRVVALLNIV